MFIFIDTFHKNLYIKMVIIPRTVIVIETCISNVVIYRVNKTRIDNNFILYNTKKKVSTE